MNRCAYFPALKQRRFADSSHIRLYFYAHDGNGVYCWTLDVFVRTIRHISIAKVRRLHQHFNSMVSENELINNSRCL